MVCGAVSILEWGRLGRAASVLYINGEPWLQCGHSAMYTGKEAKDNWTRFSTFKPASRTRFSSVPSVRT